MKKLLLPLIIGVSFSAKAQLYCDAVYADNNVVLATVNSKLYRSTDGGNSFDHILLGGQDNVDIRAFAKVNNTIVAGGISGSSRVFRSTDNGQSWTAATSGMSYPVTTCALTVGDTVFMGGTGFFRYSVDEGQTWNDVPGIQTSTATNAIRYTGGKLWHSSMSTMHYSSDWGATWQTTSATPLFGGNAAVGFIQIADTLVMLSNESGGSAVKRTYDNGTTWHAVTGSGSVGQDMIEIGGTLYATSHSGFQKSSDNGLTWTLVCSSYQSHAYGGKMWQNGNDIWIASANGVVRYSITGDSCTIINSFVTTGIKEEQLSKNLSVYPNPATNQIHMDYIGFADISIADCTGRIAYSQTKASAAESIDISGLSKGVYIITIQNEKEKYVTRFVKQ